MKRSKKSDNQNNPPPITNPNPSSPNPSGENSDLNTSAVNLEIEDQQTALTPVDDGFMAKVRRAAEKSGLFADDDGEPERTETRGRKKKTAAQDEFNTLTIALLSLVIAAVNVPENIKPNDNELNQFSHHLTGLLVRHLPISGKFSADALDIIGLLAVGSGYYARVAPMLKTKSKEQTPEQYYFNANDLPAPVPVADAITRINPSVGNWLNEKALQGGAA